MHVCELVCNGNNLRAHKYVCWIVLWFLMKVCLCAWQFIFRCPTIKWRYQNNSNTHRLYSIRQQCAAAAFIYNTCYCLLKHICVDQAILLLLMLLLLLRLCARAFSRKFVCLSTADKERIKIADLWVLTGSCKFAHAKVVFLCVWFFFSKNNKCSE